VLVPESWRIGAIGACLQGAKRWTNILIGKLSPSPAAPASVLIVGPSSAGKSTLIRSSRLAELGLARPRVAYGFELSGSRVPVNALIHYNLLHLAEHMNGDWEAISASWDFAAEPIFGKILTSGSVGHCVVIVAPVAEMVERMQKRTTVEEGVRSLYRQDHWIDVVQALDLCRIYEQLFDALEKANVPYTVLFSSYRNDGAFPESNRDRVPANLMGHYT
jgi:hypothetical protein